jgi:uncharacterized membrane protein
MRGLSYVLIVLGIIVGIVGLLNHYVIKQNPFPHTSTIVLAIGAVLFVIGVLTFFMGGSKAAA